MVRNINVKYMLIKKCKIQEYLFVLKEKEKEKKRYNRVGKKKKRNNR